MPSLQSELHGTSLPFLHLIDVLKHLPRTGWLRTVKSPESVAAHMYRMAIMAMSAPDGLDKNKCIKLALTHDMGESVAGDITPHDGVSKEEKYKLEEFGFKYIKSLLKEFNPELGEELMDLWAEFEAGKTPEAKWMNEVDKLECMIQAHDYEQMTYGEKDLDEFQGPWNASMVVSPQGKNDLRLLSLERQVHFANRKQQLPLIFLIGVPGSGKKTQSTLLAKDLGFKLVSLDGVVLEKSKDDTYAHAEFLTACIENSVRVPTSLAVGLLEEKIKKSANEGTGWVAVIGFPDNMQQLVGFQRQKIAAYRDMGELEAHLSATDGYFTTINSDGSIEEVYGKVKEAIHGFKPKNN